MGRGAVARGGGGEEVGGVGGGVGGGRGRGIKSKGRATNRDIFIDSKYLKNKIAICLRCADSAKCLKVKLVLASKVQNRSAALCFLYGI